VVHLANCETQDLYNTGPSDMNESQSWSLPSLNFLSADFTWLDMYIWLSPINPCLHSGETRYDLNNGCFSLLIILNVSNKSNHKWLQNVLMWTEFAQRISQKKDLSEQQLACRWTWNTNLKLHGYNWNILASCDKVITTWLRFEK